MNARTEKSLALVAMGACVLLIVANVHTFLGFRRHRALASGQHYKISGRTLDGRYISLAGESPRCSVLRFASADCSYCRDDTALFESLERASRGQGCKSVLIAPVPALFPHPLSEQRVNLAFGTSLDKVDTSS